MAKQMESDSKIVGRLIDSMIGKTSAVEEEVFNDAADMAFARRNQSPAWAIAFLLACELAAAKGWAWKPKL